MPKKKTRPRTNRSALTSAGQDSQIAYRVWKLDAATKESVHEKRLSRKPTQTVREFITDAVETELSELVSQLAELGIAIEDSASISPVRYPMAESTLKALRHASH